MNMTPKMGLLVGLMVGFVLAVASSVVTMIVVGGTVSERESKAYDEGVSAGLERARIGGGKVSDVLNKGLLQENADRARRADEAKAKLKELAAIEGLPEAAKTKAQEVMDALGQ